MRATPPLLAVIALALVGGCLSDVQRLDGEAAPAGTVHPAAASSPPTSPTPSGPTGQTAEPCRTSNLSGEINTFVSVNAAGGQRTAALGFTNIGNAPCTMVGYPSLQLLAFNDQARPTKITRTSNGNTQPVPVIIGRDQRAWTLIAWFFTPSGDEVGGVPQCAPQPIAARVTPPDETVPMRIAGDFGRVCGHGEVFVGPMSLTRPQ